IGVNSQIYSRTGGFMGLSFAIPIDMAMHVVEQLKTKGRVTRGWLGVLIQDVSKELADSFGMSRPRGALVAQVLPDSPAAKSDLRVGDVIVAFNGQQINTSSELPPLVGDSPVDNPAELEVLRNGKQIKVTVVIGELPADEELDSTPAKPKKAKAGRLGLSVAPLTEEQREALKISEGGVVVEEVGSGAAAKAGIRPGDVITMINNKPVKDVEQFKTMVKELPAGRSVAVLVHRESGPMFLALRIPSN
ncbi:MAG TPA: PDZ domain-containing protein, partial [Chromatiales bacterium]|nr:PDZ domain-containing protein [Chromatiales bacterium]